MTPQKRSTSIGSFDFDADSEKLKQILYKALARIGAKDEGNKCAKELSQKLADLYIRTPDQLKAALDDSDVIRDVKHAGIRGILLSAVRTELERREEKSAQRLALIKSVKPKKELNKPLLRWFEVARADFTQLSDIDHVFQTFRARLFLKLRIPKGALDNDLVKDFEGFPFDEDGRPTFRPSARWYLNQIDFPNGRNIKIIETEVTATKNDLLLIMEVEGEFFERFELQNFPFDAQDLTITFSMNCANEGPVPAAFVEADSPKLGVDTINFAFDDEWVLSPSVTPEITTVGATAQRRFPAVHLRACVSRRPIFILLNVAAPSSIISILSLTTYFVPPEDTADRLNLSITILLTAVAFKIDAEKYLPQISYLTLVDRFVLLCTSSIVLGNISHVILAVLNWVKVQHATLEKVNIASLVSLGAYWLYVQIWFFYRANVAKKSDTDAGQRRTVDVDESIDPLQDSSRRNSVVSQSVR